MARNDENLAKRGTSASPFPSIVDMHPHRELPTLDVQLHGAAALAAPPASFPRDSGPESDFYWARELDGMACK